MLAIAIGRARRVGVVLFLVLDFFRHFIQRAAVALRRALLGTDAAGRPRAAVSAVQHHQIRVFDIIGVGSVLHQQRQALEQKENERFSLENDRPVDDGVRPTSSCSFSAASLSGERPNLSKMTLAPLASNQRTTSTCPRLAAKCRGVAPSPSFELMSTPLDETCIGLNAIKSRDGRTKNGMDQVNKRPELNKRPFDWVSNDQTI